MKLKRQVSADHVETASKKKVQKILSEDKNLKIVITGEMKMIPRDQLEKKLKNEGFIVNSAVSGLTSILLMGEKLEDGRDVQTGNKYKKARELIESGKSKADLKIMTELEFFETFPQIKTEPIEEKVEIGDQNNVKEEKYEHFGLWSDRYRPVSLSNFVANQDIYSNAKNWLSGWSKDTKPKAFLLVGSPGIGKTSIVLALAKNLDWNLLEFNASDTRNQKKLKELHVIINGGQVLYKGSLSKKTIILMDEIDGLSAGDRGGSTELIKLIQTAKVPIFLTCNNQNHEKIRSLLKYCRIETLKKCSKLNALKRARNICKIENVDISDTLIEKCFDASDGDMRYFLNLLQSNSLTSMAKFSTSLKDTSIYDSFYILTKKIFNEVSAKDFKKIMDYFYIDYSMVPLFVQENLLNTYQNNHNQSNLANVYYQLFRAYDSICFGDEINNKIKMNSRWDLLPEYGYYSTFIPALFANKNAQYRVEFPQLLGKISSRNKNLRELDTVSAFIKNMTRSRYITSGYIELLGDHLIEPLQSKEKSPQEKVEDFWELAKEYNFLQKDILYTNLIDLRFKISGNPFDQVDTKTKTNLTKLYKQFEVKYVKSNKSKETPNLNDISEISEQDIKTGSDEEDHMNSIW